jgi:hypothetical protein
MQLQIFLSGAVLFGSFAGEQGSSAFESPRLTNGVDASTTPSEAQNHDEHHQLPKRYLHSPPGPAITPLARLGLRQDPSPTPVAVLVMGTGTYTIRAGGDSVLFGDATIVAGQAAQTVDGQAISFGTQGLIIDGGKPVARTFPVVPSGATLPPSSAATPTDAPNAGVDGVVLNLGNTSFTYVEGVSRFGIGSTTITSGGPAATVGQSVVSLGPQGLVVDGKSIAATPLASLPAGVTAPPKASGSSSSSDGFRQNNGDGGSGSGSGSKDGSAKGVDINSGAEDLDMNMALMGVILLAGSFTAFLI